MHFLKLVSVSSPPLLGHNRQFSVKPKKSYLKVSLAGFLSPFIVFRNGKPCIIVKELPCKEERCLNSISTAFCAAHTIIPKPLARCFAHLCTSWCCQRISSHNTVKWSVKQNWILDIWEIVVVEDEISQMPLSKVSKKCCCLAAGAVVLVFSVREIRRRERERTIKAGFSASVRKKGVLCVSEDPYNPEGAAHSKSYFCQKTHMSS